MLVSTSTHDRNQVFRTDPEVDIGRTYKTRKQSPPIIINQNTVGTTSLTRPKVLFRLIQFL